MTHYRLTIHFTNRTPTYFDMYHKDDAYIFDVIDLLEEFENVSGVTYEILEDTQDDENV